MAEKMPFTSSCGSSAPTAMAIRSSGRVPTSAPR